MHPATAAVLRRSCRRVGVNRSARIKRRELRLAPLGTIDQKRIVGFAQRPPPKPSTIRTTSRGMPRPSDTNGGKFRLPRCLADDGAEVWLHRLRLFGKTSQAVRACVGMSRAGDMRADDGEQVALVGQSRQEFAEAQTRRARFDRGERAADFDRRIGLGIERIEMARPPHSQSRMTDFARTGAAARAGVASPASPKAAGSDAPS